MPPMDAQDLRDGAIRRVFDKFDADGSGAVSTEEITKMVKQLKLDWGPAKIKALMMEADPDKSGQIEFEEFKTVLQKQLKAGGDLAGVVSEASSAFGWLNPLSWFGAEQEAEKAPKFKPKASKSAAVPGSPAAVPAPSKSPSKSPSKLKKKASPKSTPKQSAPASPVTPYPLGSKSLVSASRSGRSSPSTRSSPTSPTRRMKKTQGAVRQANLEDALVMREESIQAKAWWKEQQQQFLAEQHEKVLKGHQQAMERQEALERLKQKKREMGTDMRENIKVTLMKESEAKRERIAASHSTVFEARKKKQAAVRSRVEKEREQAVAIGEAAKVARAQRKEETKATVRAQEQAAKEFTASVRYETRPEVRAEGINMFQAQRDAIAREERLKQERDAREIAERQAKYLQMADRVKANVETLRQSSMASRANAFEAKRQAAESVRTQIQAVREVKRQTDDMQRQGRKQLHDEIHQWKTESVTYAV